MQAFRIIHLQLTFIHGGKMENTIVKSKVYGTNIEYNIEVPNECPICHTRIHPILVFASRDDVLYKIATNKVSCVFTCPSCHDLFYVKNEKMVGTDSKCKLLTYGPITPIEAAFEDEIANTSPNFIKTFNQAQAAEAYNLDQISGVGYRKALEFLIKDYACKKNPSDSETIKKTPLAKCISNYIEHPDIVATATAATWIGNDETHYIRVWDNMDISNLKSFIEACIFWITMEGRASKAREMITKSKSSD